MVLSTKIQLKQSQELKLTQEMRQALQLIQWGHHDLLIHLHELEAENPLISVTESTTEETADTEQFKLHNQNQQDYKQDDMSVFGRHQIRNNIASLVDAGTVIEATKAFESSIFTQIEEQIRLNCKSSVERAIAYFWLQELDGNGRLSQKAFLRARRIEPSIAALEKLLFKLQLFDPVGLFSRNLQECWCAQLIDLEEWDSLWERLFQEIQWKKPENLMHLAAKLKIDPALLEERVMRLKKLNNYPLNMGQEAITRRVVAELIVKQSELGEWVIELNPEAFPEVTVRKLNQSQEEIQTKEHINWLKAKASQGEYLAKALHERAKSILNVGRVILQKQVGYFAYGTEYLSVMTMQEVANKLDMHESTISRLVRDKYILTPNGIVEMRWLFSSGGETGNSLSPIAIQAKIQQIIAQEPHNKPYSDEKIAEILKKMNISIARRTVAKYRETKGIPPVSMRKQAYNTNHNMSEKKE